MTSSSHRVGKPPLGPDGVGKPPLGRRTRFFLWTFGAALCSAVAAISCLPGDTRPPPASVPVFVIANESTLKGIDAASTEDGWSISFDRFLIGLGNARLGNDNNTECT